MARYFWSLVLLFFGGLMVGISAPLRDVSEVWSSIFFYLGYAIDLVAIVIGVNTWLKSRK